MGRFGEKTLNRNGERLIDFCIQNGLVILNSFFQHKDLHKYTREEPSRKEKSIIDYIIIEKTTRNIIRDVRVYRSAELSTDHFLLAATFKVIDDKQYDFKTRKNNKTEIKTIKAYRLHTEEIRDKYAELIAMEVLRIEEELQYMTLEEKWQTFKKIVNKAGTESCGIAISGGSKKRTSWWSQDIKNIIKRKKEAWKEYLRKKSEESYGKYKEVRRIVTKEIKIAKAKEWEEFGTKMEKDSRSNQKLFYNVLKNMNNKKRLIKGRQIKDKGGRILTEIEEIMPRWKEYFQNILEGTEIEDNVMEICNTNINFEENSGIEFEEVENAVRKLKNGKAPGVDNLKSELLKYMGIEGYRLLHKIIDEAWKAKQVPNDWKTSVIIPIYKNGDRKNCSNYRGISLICSACKVYEIVLEAKLRRAVENKLHGAQSGFRPGYSTQDHIFTIKNILEKFLTYNKEIYMCFIDLEKAFDKVKREEIWNALESNGVEVGLIEAIKSLYKNTTNTVKANNHETKKFRTTQGVRQGGVLSPLLFLIFMDQIIKNCSRSSRKMNVGYYKMNSIQISECVFADDIVTFASTERNLQYNVDLWSKELEDRGMRINTSKTKTIVVSNDKDRKVMIKINKNTVEQVENIKYLGAVIDSTGKQEEEINHRITSTIKLFHCIRRGLINKKEISNNTKMTVYKKIFLPTLLHGCESWVLTEKLHKKIQVVEMKYLRRVANVTVMDKIRNNTIREWLNIGSARKYVEDSQMRWWGHLKRLDEGRQVRRVWGAKRIGTRRRGRPRMTWDNEIGRVLKSKGLSWKQAEILAKDRKNWRKKIKES